MTLANVLLIVYALLSLSFFVFCIVGAIKMDGYTKEIRKITARMESKLRR